ncbi:MAG: hypothetical protein GKR90_13580 [Pseudomonadales bacterium]|nr:hypothetical protein [Pseudomonadales bacterium]
MVTKQKSTGRCNVPTNVVAGIMLGWSALAFGASQGDLGSSSTGSIGVSMVVGTTLQVESIQDVSLQVAQGETLRGETQLCISAERLDEFSVIAYGDGANNEFVLNSDSDEVTFGLAYQDVNGDLDLLPSAPVTVDADACEKSSSRLAVVVDEQVSNATYNGTLTLLVSPL